MTLLDSLVVDLGRLITALAPVDVAGPAPTDIRDLAYDARAATPGSLFFASPASAPTGTISRRRRSRTARSRSSSSASSTFRCRNSSSRTRAGDGPRGRRVLRAADLGADRRGRDRHGGKTTTAFLLYAVLAAAGRRPGLLGTIETRVNGERRPATRTTAEAIDLQRLFREMLDAGDRSCAMEATSHGSALAAPRRRPLLVARLHEPRPGPPRLPPGMEDYFDAKRRLFLGGDRAARGRQRRQRWGRRLAEDLRGRRHPLLTFGLTDDADIGATDLESTPTHTSFAAAGIAIRTRLRGRFNVENVLGVVAAARLLGCPTTRSQPGSPRWRASRAVRVDRRGTALHGVVDYAHKPGALENVLRAARELATGTPDLRLRRRGRPRPTKRPLMGRIAEELSDVPIVTSVT